MSTVLVSKPHGFTMRDRGGNVRIRSTGRGTGTVLVFKGTGRPKRVHV